MVYDIHRRIDPGGASDERERDRGRARSGGGGDAGSGRVRHDHRDGGGPAHVDRGRPGRRRSGSGDAALAAATPDEKVAMLQKLTSYTDGGFQKLLGKIEGGGGATRDLCPTPVMPDKQRAIVRILSTATDAASFDRMYFRLNPSSL